MDQFKLVLWALFFTLLVPLLAWTLLFSFVGWKLFLIAFVVFGLIFYFQDKILQSSYFQGALQMLIPFALTFRFYDALRAGRDTKQDEGNIFQVLWATSRGFVNSGEDTPEEQTNKAKSKTPTKEEVLAKREAEAAFEQAPTPPKPAAPAKPPVDLDDELAKLKAKMAKEKETAKVPVKEID